MKVVCMVCPPGAPEIPEAQYAAHMSTHGGSQAAGRIIAQNLPPQPLPNGITPEMLPNDDFLKIVEEGEKAQSAPPPPKPQSPARITPAVPQELKLKYVWQGVCPTCNSGVRTIMTKVDGRLFATAYCLSHEEIKQQEVYPLDDGRKVIDDLYYITGMPEPKKTPAVVAKPSPLPEVSLDQAKVNDKSQKDLTTGVSSKTPIISRKRVKK